MHQRIGAISFCLIILSGLISSAFAQERVALVIGNGAYQNAIALANPANDANDMTVALRELGFEVIAATDVDKAGFDSKLREFARALRSARTALFYYAGHGLQVAGKNYAVPVDARLDSAADLPVETIDIERVMSVMQADDNRVNLVFLDACRDNPLARSFARALPQARAVSVGTGLTAVDAGRGTMIAFATAPNKVAFDGQGQRNSLFTTSLLRHIRTPGLDIAFVLRRVTADVEAASGGAQVPWIHASLTTDVVLKRGDGAVPLPPPLPAIVSINPNVIPSAPSRIDAPNEPLPADMPVDPAMLRLVETHAFFANAPPVLVGSYNVGITTNSATSGAGTMAMNSNDATVARWLRQGLVRLDETKRYTVNNSGSTGNYSTRSSALSVANGLFYLVYKMQSSAGGRALTTTSHLARIDNIQGRVFPLAVGNRFSYDSIYQWKSSAMKGGGGSTSENSCEVTKKYEAKVFHVELTGMAYLLVCDSRSTQQDGSPATNSKTHDVFFESLGVWIRADPVSPQERFVTNNQTTVTGKYTTVTNGTHTLKSFALAR